jgi:phosphoglycerate-specific signal transduction histidine kinase
MAEEIELQTMNDVRTIDYMRTTNQAIDETISTQSEIINNISDNLDTITEAVISNPTVSTDIDLSEVHEKLDNIDTSVVETQTQDILSIVNNQQEQINDIKNDITSINDKLDAILNKL